VHVGGLTYDYVYGADDQRLMSIVPQGSGQPDRVTLRFSEVEIDDTGTWSKHLHADVKRRGNGVSAQKFFHHRDHLVSIRFITDSAGADVSRMVYAPFGRIAQQSGRHSERRSWISERRDSLISLAHRAG
jgi:hypothetical protein